MSEKSKLEGLGAILGGISALITAIVTLFTFLKPAPSPTSGSTFTPPEISLSNPNSQSPFHEHQPPPTSNVPSPTPNVLLHRSHTLQQIQGLLYLLHCQTIMRVG